MSPGSSRHAPGRGRSPGTAPDRDSWPPRPAGPIRKKSALAHDPPDHVVDRGHLHAVLERIAVIITVAEPVPASFRIDLEQIRHLFVGEVAARDAWRLRVDHDDAVAGGPLVEPDVMVELVPQELG